ncbi:MAG: hypothetical protein VX460_01975 [Planctomycetota bacterium]|nr:hypothetical protein [Planctomycetota bacterium]
MAKDKPKKKNKAAKPNDGPTPADAEVVLKLYELRRERVMRASRETLLRWFPESYDDLAAFADFGSEQNAAFRQVTSYFEMAFGLARRGAVHPELLMDWCGEGVFLYAKIEPFLAEFRERVSPTAFANAQWVVENTEAGRAKLELHRSRLVKRG